MTAQATRSVALIGSGPAAVEHARAWTAVRVQSDSAGLDLGVLCGPGALDESDPAGFGWRMWDPDWRAVIQRSDVDIVDICGPTEANLEIAIAALEAGKHVICERPMAGSVAEAELMTRAASAAASRGVRSMVVSTHRHLAALTRAHQLVSEGRLGVIRHVHGQYLHDASASPPVGCLEDLGATVLDAAEFVSGLKFDSVSAVLHTFGSTRAGERLGDRRVDDAALVHARMSGGALASIEATRIALGHTNVLRLEVDGTLGSLALEVGPNARVQFYDSVGSTTGLHEDMGDGAASIQVAVADGLGAFLRDIAAGETTQVPFSGGLHLQRVVDAIQRSSENGSAWTPLDRDPTRRIVGSQA